MVAGILGGACSSDATTPESTTTPVAPVEPVTDTGAPVNDTSGADITVISGSPAGNSIVLP